MNRDELKALELSDEQINGVMKLYGKSVVERKNRASILLFAQKNLFFSKKITFHIVKSLLFFAFYIKI